MLTKHYPKRNKPVGLTKSWQAFAKRHNLDLWRQDRPAAKKQMKALGQLTKKRVSPSSNIDTP